MLPEVRAAHLGDVSGIASMLGRAFRDDPVSHFLFPLPGDRAAKLSSFFALQLRHQYLPRGEVYTVRDWLGASLWIPPRPRPMRPKDAFAQLTLVRIMWGRFREARRLALILAAHHPKVAHFYLATIGVEPRLQHQGLGSALMVPVLVRCDETDTPAYLECSKEENIPLYRKHGFVVTEDLQIPGGPRIWLMWRAPTNTARKDG